MAIHAKQRFEHGNLICIPRENNSTRVSPSTEFAVASSRTSAVRQNPKIDYGLRSLSRRILTKMLIFVWSRKLISRLICRTIPGYNLFRRDRGWLGRDKRKNGGIAIYVRKNLKVLNIYRSSLYELICVTLLLPSGHRFLICGFYNPPKHQYREQDLIDYIISLMDNESEKHPDSVLLCGSDVNCLDVHELQALSGWNVMVDFPTGGNACLDYCFTNRADLFGSPYSIHMLIKTDLQGVILPAGTKPRPVRRKVQIRDTRKHRKEALYLALNAEDWREVLLGNNIDCVVNNMEKKIRTLMDKCMPLKSVRLSSRDPVWMTPLVKSMLREKSRISCNNVERHKVINSRISEVISANRKNPRLVIGSREWWKNVDLVSQRRNSTYVNLDSDSLNDLNDFFALLCSDDSYVPPSDVVIAPDVEIPQITERQVWNILAKLKRTATGPDEIPYWFWADHAELLTPVITHIWNLSLATHSWPTSWKRANINPLPKVEVPKENSHYRSINITPIIARAFEKAVHHTHGKQAVEGSLSQTQFAYRQGVIVRMPC